MDGIVVVDKPAGMTSHDVVDVVRKRMRERRVGHAGTLDPNATGVLVVGVGRATRLLPYVARGAKRYLASARFGISTTTQDAWGRAITRVPVALRRADVAAALPRYVGEIEQTPPMISAVKVGGERLYRKARRGEEVERARRRVTVTALELVGWSEGEHPEATLAVSCSAGTYVRTLIADLGDALGCGAHLTALRRTQVGDYTEEDALALADVGPSSLRPLLAAVAGLPRLDADEEMARHVASGRPLQGGGELVEGQPVAVVRGGDLLAVYARRGDALVAEKVVGS
jgi:tRNA pseudouridine55 synthase